VPSTLNAFLDRYRRALAVKDLDALVELVHLPCLVMGPRVRAVTDEPELREALRAQLEQYERAGIAQMSFDVLAHRRIDARYLRVDVAWEMHDAAGATVMDFALSYTLTAPERGWRVVTIAPLERGLLEANPTGAHSIPPELRRR